MNLYKISQVHSDYETYDSAVVVAETEDDARKIHPSEQPWDGTAGIGSSWTDSQYVQVKYIGIAAPELEPNTVICASFLSG